MKQSISSGIRIFLVSVVALLFVFAVPIPAFAATNTDSSAPTQPSSGPKKPPGPAGGTYTFNTNTGLWENEHYTWNPATQQTEPKQPKDYSYNPTTGMWDTVNWAYSPEAGKYVQNTTSQPGPTPSSKSNTTTTPSNNKSAPTAQPLDQPTSATITSPTNGVTDNSASSGTFDLFYNSSISNTITSDAQSGDATVTKNTKAGDALTGDALSMANVFNLLQSSWTNLRDQGFVSFISNVFGDVVGDLLIDPNALPSGDTSSTAGSSGNTDINISNNNQINNDISLAAQSGNASVSNNTSAGSASTGSATALANVVNIINSVIGSGQSFLGLINIHGNLNGDILMPEEFLANLIASNAPRASIDATKLMNQTSINLNDTQSIKNNVTLSAQSGQAVVDKNTAAGNATSGDSDTNLTIFNLTGKNIVGSDSLLVFVNVLGEWVGMIVNAPEGSTSAILGDSNSSVSDTTHQNLTSNSIGTITNNISLVAATGDADVTKNTNAGNATSGRATAAANLVNITGSTLNLSNWFGILFINVLGSWHGSFGINTANGSLPQTPSTASTQGTSLAQVSSNQPRVFRFINNNNNYVPEEIAYGTGVEDQILAAVTSSPEEYVETIAGFTDVNNSTPSSPSHDESKNLWIPVAGTLLGATLLAAERIVSILQRRRLLHTV